MSDLRAPDPTLAVHRNNGGHSVLLAWRTDDLDVPPLAHRLNGPCTFGSIPSCVLMPAPWAAWFAVPCRACFRDAPPPGHYADPSVADPASGLAWQTAGAS